MTIDAATVRKIASLSRIAVTEEDIQYYAPQIQGILKWVEQLQDIDTSQVEPLASVAEIHLPLRPDCVTDGDKQNVILANAPESLEGFFVVPKIVE
jgi:aspartyl-tRNA(Asn)/glutamyl-tRNA(Gln) amidotransferase subunit C